MDLCFLFVVVNDCLCNKETEFLIVPEEDMVGRLPCPCIERCIEVRIPFPREVTDEKGAKSSFNSMSQLAWEVEKNYNAPDFKKVKQLKQITYRGQDRSDVKVSTHQSILCYQRKREVGRAVGVIESTDEKPEESPKPGR
ncbi:Glutamyl-tRNA reductase-binding protein, chloroplastic [Vitis vinifera]|uniref:Glutamyl-tRNA reductase-binding protein, chloroplastic n=1 Tax=Vitis vinifera TaxID=29760 RepID=A0A438BUF5_VITVI|nr:Glutamyl-tRNA reductase-binding protein, chloroplastic [Vitis vinifera]